MIYETAFNCSGLQYVRYCTIRYMYTRYLWVIQLYTGIYHIFLTVPY